MSLRKNPTITEKRIAARQTNGGWSHGSATPGGGERVRAVDLAPTSLCALRMLGMQESSFGQICRLANLLLKTDLHARKELIWESSSQTLEVNENTATSQELGDMRWPQQKIKSLKSNKIISLRCGGAAQKKGAPK